MNVHCTYLSFCVMYHIIGCHKYMYTCMNIFCCTCNSILNTSKVEFHIGVLGTRMLLVRLSVVILGLEILPLCAFSHSRLVTK